MEKFEIYSWIFLAIAMSSEERPAKRNDISLMADAINHAVPTQNELNSSINWLMRRNLVKSSDKNFQLSRKGKSVYSKARKQSDRTVFGIWNKLEDKLQTMPNNA